MIFLTATWMTSLTSKIMRSPTSVMYISNLIYYTVLYFLIHELDRSVNKNYNLDNMVLCTLNIFYKNELIRTPRLKWLKN